MIATLTGTVQHIGIEHLIVQVGGSIGLHVCVPKNVIDKLHQTNEKTISLFTHLVVRETELSLYGFGSDEDRELFLLLIKVNKIGPKLATTILSSLSPEMIKSAVAHEEPAILQRVPGVGKKSAETIIHLQIDVDARTPPPFVCVRLQRCTQTQTVNRRRAQVATNAAQFADQCANMLAYVSDFRLQGVVGIHLLADIFQLVVEAEQILNRLVVQFTREMFALLLSLSQQAALRIL